MTPSPTVLPPRMRRIFAVSLGAGFAVIVILTAVVFAIGAPTAEASTCTLTTTTGAANWTDTTKWTGCGATYPGANPGDTAIVNISTTNVNVDAIITNGVILQLTAGNVIHDMGLDNVYNARIQVRVLNGDGKVAAYGSIIDMLTQDPTYVPAQ